MSRDDDGRSSFDAWATARQRRLLRSTYLMTGDLQRAEDLVQEALIKVAQRWSRLEHGNADAYIRTVLYRDHVSWWRRRRETPVAAFPDRQDPRSASVESRLVVRDALLRLPARQRAVLVLRYFEDLTEVETAAALGIAVGTVKSQAHDALERLRSTAPDLQTLTGREDDDD